MFVCYFSSVPSAPTTVAVDTIPGQPNQLLVSWQPPNVPNGQITEYMLYCFESTLLDDGYDLKNDSIPSNIPYKDSVSNNTVLGSEMSAVMSGLEPYTDYHCIVVASTSIGIGELSALVSGVTDQSSKPIHTLT